MWRPRRANCAHRWGRNRLIDETGTRQKAWWPDIAAAAVSGSAGRHAHARPAIRHRCGLHATNGRSARPLRPWPKREPGARKCKSQYGVAARAHLRPPRSAPQRSNGSSWPALASPAPAPAIPTNPQRSAATKPSSMPSYPRSATYGSAHSHTTTSKTSSTASSRPDARPAPSETPSSRYERSTGAPSCAKTSQPTPPSS